MIRTRYILDFQWPVQEPFLFCVHHHDKYPPGTESLGIEAKHLAGRHVGQDFIERDGFRMYHGENVPGFPVHPHRGFETITVVRKGFVDHADSLGAAARYGEGDVQWMTAGTGVQHSEMFPLLNKNEGNTLELFQIWLNLPRKSKAVPAHFKMFWSEKIPRIRNSENGSTVTLIAGEFEGHRAISPPPDSWAADPDHEVLILLVELEKGGRFHLPPSRQATQRALYFFQGSDLEVGTSHGEREKMKSPEGAALESEVELQVLSPNAPAQFLILQALPMGEPVFQHGPFVMNTREDILRTIEEYRKTEFGGWPWPQMDMVHAAESPRFARYPDGRTEKP